jgi:hypothetical protein
MEVMIALVILSIGLFTVLSNQAATGVVRKEADEHRRAREVADLVMHAIQGASWDDLNNLDRPETYLTWARPFDINGVQGTNWLTDTRVSDPSRWLAGAPASEPDRRLPTVTGLVDLRVYVEYFRAVTARDENGATLPDPDVNGGFLTGGLFAPGGVAPSRPQPNITGSFAGTPPPALPVRPLPLWKSDRDPGMADSLEGPLDAPEGASAIPGVEQTRATTLESHRGVRFGSSDPVGVRVVVTWRSGHAGTDATVPLQHYLQLISARRR